MIHIKPFEITNVRGHQGNRQAIHVSHSCRPVPRRSSHPRMIKPSLSLQASCIPGILQASHSSEDEIGFQILHRYPHQRLPYVGSQSLAEAVDWPLMHFRRWAMLLNDPEPKHNRSHASFPSHFSACNDTVGTCPRVSSGTGRCHRIPTFPKVYKYTCKSAGSLWHLFDAVNFLKLSSPRRVLREIGTLGHQ